MDLAVFSQIKVENASTVHAKKIALLFVPVCLTFFRGNIFHQCKLSSGLPKLSNCMVTANKGNVLMIRILVASIALIALTMLNAACNGGTSTTSTTPTAPTTATQTATSTSTTADTGAPDPCDLINKVDAAGIMGEDLQDHTHVEMQGGVSCVYKTVAQPPRSLTLTIIKPCSMADYSNLASGEPVENLGMHASWNKSLLTVHTENDACIITDGGGPARSDAPGDDTTALMNAKWVAAKLIYGLINGPPPAATGGMDEM